MARMIPKSTKVKIEFLKGFNFGDIFVILFALIFLALAWTSGFSTVAKLVISGEKSVYVGVILMALGAAFAIIRKEITIWTILIFILAIADIAIGLYRKKRGM